jgi:SnoaL-like domain
MGSVTGMGQGKAVAVESELAVRRLVARYCHLVDDDNYEGVADLFTADGKVIIGEAQHVGRDGIMAWLGGAPSGTQHLVTNVIVSNGSNEGTLHVIADLAMSLRMDGKWAIVAVGRYHDTIVEDGGAFHFTQRIITIR